ncbi:hypothetical protein [Paludisphaera sp.]|uniref:hypothetical protein n=1 Tax=Paludisphaera sp. TaxID=2017432 RepID=UPI00301BECF2
MSIREFFASKLDDPDPVVRAHARHRLAAMESGEPPAHPAPNPHMTLLKLARECPHAGPWSEGCGCARRCARLDRDVVMVECLECVKADGRPVGG